MIVSVQKSPRKFAIGRTVLIAGMWWVPVRLALHESASETAVFGLYSTRLVVVIIISAVLALSTTVFAYRRAFAKSLEWAEGPATRILTAGILFGGGTVFLSLFSPPFFAESLLGLAAAFTVATAFLFNWRWGEVASARDGSGTPLQNWALCAGAIVFGIVVMELGLRYCLGHASCWRAFNVDAPHLLRGVSFKFSPHPYLAYYPTPNYRSPYGHNAHNSLGYRGAEEYATPKPDGVYRIVALGGSTTYSDGVQDWRQSYPAQLQRILREDHGLSKLEVVNAGVGGHTSFDTLANLEFRILDLQPDLLLIYHAVNDVNSRLVPSSLYRGDNTARRSSWDEAFFLQWQYRIPLKFILLLGVKFGWFEQPEVAVLAGGSVDPDYDSNGVPSWMTAKNIDPLTVLDQNPPKFFERNLTNLAAIAKAHEIDVALVSFALRDTAKTHTDVDKSKPWHYARGVSEHNAVAKRIADRKGLIFIDLAQSLPRSPDNWDRDGVHYSATGNVARARIIAENLFTHGIFKPHRQ